MKLTLHIMFGCRLCAKAALLLHRWKIPFQSVYDGHVKDRPYPYITIELEYEELKDWILREKLDEMS